MATGEPRRLGGQEAIQAGVARGWRHRVADEPVSGVETLPRDNGGV